MSMNATVTKNDDVLYADLKLAARKRDVASMQYEVESITKAIEKLNESLVIARRAYEQTVKALNEYQDEYDKTMKKE